MTTQAAPSTAADREHAIRAIKLLLFSASLVPAMVGGAIAAATGAFTWQPLLLATLGLFLGQLAGDYFYFYFIHFHTDARDAHTKIFAGWRPLLAGTLLQPAQTLHAGILCLACDGLIAAYFYHLLGVRAALFALAGGLVAVFFTPLMRRGLKEPVIFITFGPLCVAGVVLAVTGSIPTTAWVASVPVGCFVTAVAYLKSARFDVVQQGRDQVVLRLNPNAVLGLLAFGYASLIVAVSARQLPLWTLSALLSLPLAFTVADGVRAPTRRVSDYLWNTVRSLLVLILVGCGIAAGFLV